MSRKNIIGRHQEVATFEQLYASKKSEFVAVYGRRRVGKTFLIKELYATRYTFHITGLSRGDMKAQIHNFHTTLLRFAPDLEDAPLPDSWFSAFQLLIHYLEKNTSTRKVIFMDELPWMDTPKSGFITALEHFWNAWAYHRNDILLIVCGSATSWMIDELINHHGGLHNRVTTRMRLHPFTLRETEQFLKSRGGIYDRYQIIQLYMAMGGIPFYLENIDPQKSVAQNIDYLFFSKDGLLKTEFQNLYRSLFKSHEKYELVIEKLAKKSKGMSRKELLAATKLSNGGTFTGILTELEQCGFINRYIPFGKQQRDSLYQLTDQYSLFYLKFVKNSKSIGSGAWLAQLDAPKWRAWSGYAYESICAYHIENIKKALGIQGVYCEISAWRSRETPNGAQIDLVIDRRDRVINICEMKFSQKPFVINKSYAKNLQNKLHTFRSETQTNKTLFLTMITTFGLKENTYSMSLVQNDLSMGVLFEE